MKKSLAAAILVLSLSTTASAMDLTRTTPSVGQPQAPIGATVAPAVKGAHAAVYREHGRRGKWFRSDSRLSRKMARLLGPLVQRVSRRAPRRGR